jgi:hypothetical protein
VRKLLARGLVGGEVCTLARVGVIWSEGRRIGLRRDLAQGRLGGRSFIWPVQLVELLLNMLEDVVRTLVRGRRGLYPR